MSGIRIHRRSLAGLLLTPWLGSKADAMELDPPALPDNACEISGLSIWPRPLIGEIGYLQKEGVLERCSAAQLKTSQFFGAYSGRTGSVVVHGVAPMLFVPGLVGLRNSLKVYMSAKIPGRVTTVYPTCFNEVIVELGILIDDSGYNRETGSTHRVLIQPKASILLG